MENLLNYLREKSSEEFVEDRGSIRGGSLQQKVPCYSFELEKRCSLSILLRMAFKLIQGKDNSDYLNI